MANESSQAAHAHELLKRIRSARSHAPIDEMERLLGLTAADERIAQLVIEDCSSLLQGAAGDPGLAWCLLVAGELGPAGILLSLDVRREDGVFIEAAASVVSRRALEVFDDILRVIRASSDRGCRRALYEGLEAVLVGGDDALKAQLRTFALERLQAETEDPQGRIDAVVIEPLSLLAYLGDEHIQQRIDAVAKACWDSPETLYALNDLEAALSRGVREPELAREWSHEDWQAATRRIATSGTHSAQAVCSDA